MKKVAAQIISLNLVLGGIWWHPEYEASPSGDDLQPRGVVALGQTLLDLANPFTVMFAATNVDDLDLATLAFYRMKLGARVIIVLATRGIDFRSIDSKVQRARIERRTSEALRAARLVEADIYFLDLPDVARSATADDVRDLWQRSDSVKRLVRAIRLMRPDVVVASHKPRSRDAQDAVLESLCVEAADASAVPQMFAEADTEAWRVKRLFFAIGEGKAELPAPFNTFDPLRGVTYEALGARFRSGSSAGPGSTSRPSYKLITSLPDLKEPAESFLDGLTLPESLLLSLRPPVISGLPLHDAVARSTLLDLLIEKLLEQRAEGSPSDLRGRYGVDFFRLLQFTGAIERAIALLLGIDAKADIDDSILVPGQRFTVEVTLINAGDRLLPAVFHFPTSAFPTPGELSFDQTDVAHAAGRTSVSGTRTYEVPATAQPTLDSPAALLADNYFPAGSSLPGALGEGLSGHRLLTRVEVGLGQTTLELPLTVRFDTTDAVEIEALPVLFVEDWSGRRTVDLDVRLRNRTWGPLVGALWIVPLALSHEEYEPLRVSFQRQDEEALVGLRINVPILKPPLSPDLLIEFRRERPAVPNALGQARVKVRQADFSVEKGLKTGYLSTEDEYVSSMLEQLGVPGTEVASKSMLAVDHSVEPPVNGCVGLSGFDSILMSAQLLRKPAGAGTMIECLLDYARSGGCLILLPGTVTTGFESGMTEEWTVSLPPFDAAMRHSGPKVAPRVRLPEHALLSVPNQITERDLFGLNAGLAAIVRAQRDVLVSIVEIEEMSGAAAGLIVAGYGEGYIVYCAFELNTSADGAAGRRLFSNLISAPRTLRAK